MPKLLLIDGHALAFRAFYATAHSGNVMTTSGGEWTNAVFVFVSKLFQIWNQERPDYIAVAFDVGKTFRHEKFPAYKAQRAKAPDELHNQVERIKQVLQAFNIPIVTCAGFEADDVLGTISRQAAAREIDSVILTGDSDILQLVDAHTRVLLSRGRAGAEKLYGPPELAERYNGLSAGQLIDLKALTGDSSDNIPGVRGIGPKTATSLLTQYNAIENIYDHLDEITGKRSRNALQGHRQEAMLYKDLVTIRCDTPVQLDWEQAQAGNFDKAAVAEVFAELEFHALLNRIPAGMGFGEARIESAAAQPAIETHYITVDTEAKLHRMLAALQAAPAIAFDTETTSTRPMAADLVGFSVAVEPGRAWYVPVGHGRARSTTGDATNQETLPLFASSAPPSTPDETQLPLDLVIAQIKPIFENPDIAKYGHNASYDIAVLSQTVHIQIAGLAFDTMIAGWLLAPGSRALGLKAMTRERLGIEMTPITDLIGKGKAQITFDQVPVADAAPYACADADMTFRLVAPLTAELHEKEQWKLFTEIEMPMIPILTQMEMTGVKLDVDFMRQMSRQLAVEKEKLEKQIHQLAQHPFNINSTKQLSQVLFEELGLPRQGIRKTVHGYSTAAQVLEMLKDKHEIVPLILEHRQIAKLKSTYVDTLPKLVNPKTGRVHTSYHQTGAITGRLSSSDPNLQNIPIRTEMGRKIRRGFVAEKGWVLLAADYSQVELRVLAHVSQDPELLDAFHRGQDVHARTAAAVYGIPIDQVSKEQRRIAKTVNFGLIYGQSAYGLSRQTELYFDEAERFIKTYFERYPGVKKWLDDTRRLAYEQGYVETLLGRRRYFPELHEHTPSKHTYAGARAAAERQAINAPIQGAAADILKIAMINLDRALKENDFRAQMALQVHDEVVLQVPKTELDAVCALTRRVMETAYPLCVPLQVDVEIGENWLDMTPV